MPGNVLDDYLVDIVYVSQFLNGRPTSRPTLLGCSFHQPNGHSSTAGYSPPTESVRGLPPWSKMHAFPEHISAKFQNSESHFKTQPTSPVLILLKGTQRGQTIASKRHALCAELGFLHWGPLATSTFSHYSLFTLKKTIIHDPPRLIMLKSLCFIYHEFHHV